MMMFAAQVVFFIALAFGLGCLFGCWFRRRFAAQDERLGVAAAVKTPEGSTRTATAGGLEAASLHFGSGILEQGTSASPAPTGEGKDQPVPAAATAVTPASEPASKSGRKPTKAKAARSRSEKPHQGSRFRGRDKGRETSGGETETCQARARRRWRSGQSETDQRRGTGDRGQAECGRDPKLCADCGLDQEGSGSL